MTKVSDERKRLPIDALEPAAVESALDRIERDGIAPHQDSTTYEVLARGRAYPPIAVVAFAYEAMTHEKPPG